MLRRVVLLLLVACLTASAARPQEKTFTIETSAAQPPMELHESIRALLAAERAIQFYDPSGASVCELWFVADVQGDATAEQLKNGATYRELKETQLLGAVRFDQPWHDYRKQRIAPGVYTLRLAFQPAEGDHAGKSLYTEFLLLAAAAKDTAAAPMLPRDLIDMSRKSIDSAHPAVLMLFPCKVPEKTGLVTKARNHVVLQTACTVKTVGAEGKLGIGLTLSGEAAD
jgi:hypothetical protein